MGHCEDAKPVEAIQSSFNGGPEVVGPRLDIAGVADCGICSSGAVEAEAREERQHNLSLM